MNLPILITGRGPTAAWLVERLQAAGFNSLAVDYDAAPFEGAAGGGSRLIHCRGTAGQFQVTLAQGVTPKAKPQVVEVAAIVLADDLVVQPNLAAWRLTPGDQIRFLADASRPAAACSADHLMLFLNDIETHSQTPVTAAMLQAALEARQAGASVVFMTGNLKVAGPGLEALSWQARQAGVTFVRFTHTRPAFSRNHTGGLQVNYYDQITGHSHTLTPSQIIVDDTWKPAPDLAELARVLRLPLDAAGFIQSDNVHRWPISTRRRGILAVGGTRGVRSEADRLQDVANAVLEIQHLQHPPQTDLPPGARINTKTCVKCLTCYRICPYRAVVLSTRPEIVGTVCERCGSCVAECPGKAIQLEGLMPPDMARRIQQAPWSRLPAEVPRLVIYACQRSAMAAYAQALEQQLPLPPEALWISLPCAGSVSQEYILEAFQQQADGVLVLTCHADNCHSEEGNRSAWRRVESLAVMLKTVGIGAHRLRVATLAANMPAELAEIVNTFSTELMQQRRLIL